MGIGRPRAYDNPEELECAGSAYFADCEEHERVPTTAGLAVYLGFCDRQSLYDYKQREGFSCVVKAMIARIEAHHEARLSGNSPTGSIFWLKNHQWSDTQQFEHSGPNGGPLKVTVEFVK